MRRPPVACRRAAQSLQPPSPQHIWISDHLLTVASNRFFRAPCPQQKRHGSHVPGPLEARRRATKRRMTLSAGFSPQDNFPVPFSLGALFGFRKDAQPLWRYEPPSLQPSMESLDPAPQHTSFSVPHVEPNPTESSAFPYNDYRNSASYSSAPNVPHIPDKSINKGGLRWKESTLEADPTLRDRIDCSAHIDDFKARTAHAGDLSGSDRSRLFAETWRACRPEHPGAWIYNVAVVQHLTEFNWDPVRILAKLKYFALPPTYTAESRNLSKCLQTLSAAFPHSSRAYLRVHTKLVEAAATAEASTGPVQDLELLELIRQSLQSAYSRGVDVEQGVVNVLAAVASKIKDPHTREPLYEILTYTNSTEHRVKRLLVRATENDTLCAALERVLLCLPREYFRSLVPSITLDLVKDVEWKGRLSQDTYRDRLTVWFAVLLNLDSRLRSTMTAATHVDAAVGQVEEHVFSNRNWGKTRPQVLLHALVFKLVQQEPSYACYRERLLQIIYSYDVSKLGLQGLITLETTLGSIFSRVRRESLPCTPLVNMAINLFVRHADLDSVYRFLTVLKLEGLKFDAHSNDQGLISEVKSLVSTKLAPFHQLAETSNAKRRQHYALTLRTCEHILDLFQGLPPSSRNSLVEEKDMVLTLQARRQFQEILDRANEHHAIPQSYRNITADTPAKQRAILIHQLAHHYSRSNTRTHRETWRAIFYLYKYLEEYDLPLGPLFTKAIVRVSIIRPLMEQRFISARRLIWVCQQVARVEGEDSAKKLESYFWRWRGDIVKHSKTVYVGVGGDSKAKTLISHMKRLGLT